MATPFLIFTLLSLPGYVLLKRFFSNAVSLGLFVGIFSALYALVFANTDLLFDLHVLATILSVTILIITILSQARGGGLSATFGGAGEFYAQKRGAEKEL